MGNHFGRGLSISIFGQSHSDAIGVTIEGLPAGFEIDTEELSSFLLGLGAADIGFSTVDDGPSNLNTAITVVVRLSDAVINEIDNAPTYTYFHHYRTVNQFLDQLALKCGFWLQQRGYKYINVAASQSIPALGSPFVGRYSHKKPAVLAGLGSVGKNNLFLHKDYGSRVRLCTVFTDAVFETGSPLPEYICLNCDKCVKACPASAISGNPWDINSRDSSFFNPQLCSDHMKKAYQKIGRGAVCGICMRVCPLPLNNQSR